MIRRNAMLAGTSYGLKFLANAVLFLALARVFGPEKFGVFSFAMTAAVFLGVIVDYGFNLQVVKELSQAPASVKSEGQNMLAGKLFLILPTLFGCLLFFFMSDLETATLIFILTFSIIFFSFGQYFFSILRAFNRFREETISTIISNVLLFVPLLVLLFFNSNIYLIATVFLVSRLVFFLLGVKVSVEDYKITINRKILDVIQIFEVLKKGFPYAMLMSTSLMFLSVDTFIVKLVQGSEAVGIYQSGIRFIFAALIISDTLMAVYLPVLSGSAVSDNKTFENRAKQLIRISIVVALPIAMILIMLPSVIVDMTLGDAYTRTAELLPYFGIILILRFLTISYGTLLTAMGLQKRRTIAVVVSLTIFAVAAFTLISTNGLVGVALASLLAHVVLLGLYCREIYSSARSIFLEQKSTFMLALSASVCAFGVWLKPGWIVGVALIGAMIPLSLMIGLKKIELQSLFTTGKLGRRTMAGK
jgi:O-antigen/teichoic acid export membrane protein